MEKKSIEGACNIRFYLSYLQVMKGFIYSFVALFFIIGTLCKAQTVQGEIPDSVAKNMAANPYGM